MTMGRELMNCLGIDANNASKRLARAGRRAQRNFPSMSRLTQRRAPRLVDDIPSHYLWLGAGLFGAVLAATLMRSRLPGAGARRVGDVMVKNVLTIEGSASMQEAAQRMREANVGMLPVVEAGRLRGVVTDRDLVIRGMARGMDPLQTPVRYIATEDLACAKPDWDLDDVARAMSDCQVGRLPVTDENDRVIGIVTLSSLALRSDDDRETLHAAQEVSRRSARSA
jgi:CBS domain-containing protein